MKKAQHDRTANAGTYPFEFSICTLVTNQDEYQEMLSSFEAAGFNRQICEFLQLDNTVENKYDGYSGLNLFLQQARGKYIILCHQDVLINKDSIGDLRASIHELDQTDPKWALCGNAGAAGPNHIVYHISYPNGIHKSKGQLPAKVSSLDENFILLKNEADLSFSADLSGFHLYGTDICLRAYLKGRTAYVIPFDITHKSRGQLSPAFFSARETFIKKYNKIFNGKWIQTTCTVFYLSHSSFRMLTGNKFVLFFVRLKNGLFKKAYP